ncbi:hypothetical protein AK830_g9111 [Neonectria ditissima]|uniref:Peptidase S33 tripeptidyl aminopeptidase-like C-terminal domain-containing protein n=1 Tax=Neonectria ditissima TaxID=78410 RepID=A0A0P7BAQ7_9HYPO|nr:hypothetical protein AK830_g9111 [Neonectria ditissima]
MRFTLFGALLAATTRAVALDSSFDWTSVTPTADLRYHGCYDEYKCARLELPLNWLNKTDNRTVAIAMIKLPATVSDDDTSFGGSVFTNPGGPGNSGVEFMLTKAHQLQGIIDNNRHYEIVSFDPRGIGISTPQSQCFQSVLARDAMTLQIRGTGGLPRGINALRYSHAIRDSYAEICQELDKNDEVMGYVGTASVARDMVAMVDKIDELRNASKRDIAGNGTNKTGLPRLQYIGFSYGSLLGNYFASMFPGRVGRVVLDGIFNAYDYFTGAGWTTSLVDTDKTYDRFFHGCFNAGSLTCVLKTENDTSPADIKTRVESFIAGLDESPLALQYEDAPLVINGDDVRVIIGSALYDPVGGFQALAYGLAQGIAGNFTILAAAIEEAGSFPSLGGDCASATANQSVPQGDEASLAVLCGDGDDVTAMDLSGWKSYVSQQVARSHIFGPYWSTIRFGCSSWRFRANWRFLGPFSTPPADSARVLDVPAAPLLFMSNRLDPVTPLRSARAMAAGHPGSGLVIQEAMGHTVVGMDPGSCVYKILADYFEFGTVPSDVAYCEPACKPWDIGCRDKTKRSVSTTVAKPTLRARRYSLGLK